MRTKRAAIRSPYRHPMQHIQWAGDIDISDSDEDLPTISDAAALTIWSNDAGNTQQVASPPAKRMRVDDGLQSAFLLDEVDFDFEADDDTFFARLAKHLDASERVEGGVEQHKPKIISHEPLKTPDGLERDVEQARDRPTTIMDLPPELYRELLSHMPPGQGVLLSLTCKNLWAKRYLKDNDCLRKLRRDTPQPERVQYLQLMGNDLPDHLFCPICEKFERRHDRFTERQMVDRHWRDAPCANILGRVEAGTVLGVSFQIPRRLLELVLRAAELGDNFGIPASCLEQYRKRRAYGITAVKVDLNVLGRIVKSPSGGALHLFVRAKQSFELDYFLDHQQQLECAGLSACGHQPREERRLLADIVTASFQDRQDGKLELNKTTSLKQCPYCPGDMQIHVSRESAQCAFATVTITSWRDLGTRASYTNTIWKAQTERWSPESFDRLAGRQYAFGAESLKDVFDRAGV